MGRLTGAPLRTDRQRFLAVLAFAKRIGIPILRVRSIRRIKEYSDNKYEWSWGWKNPADMTSVVGQFGIAHNLEITAWAFLLHEMGHFMCRDSNELRASGWSTAAAAEIWGPRSHELEVLHLEDAAAGLLSVSAGLRAARAHGVLGWNYRVLRIPRFN